MYMQWSPEVEVRSDIHYLENKRNYREFEVFSSNYVLPPAKNFLPKYMVFLDFGTNNKVPRDRYYLDGSYVQKIPEIQRMAALVCTRHEFYNSNLDYDDINFHEYEIIRDTSNPQNSYITSFGMLYFKYKSPLFLAHNGMHFDFSILLANAKRKEKNYANYAKVADTLQLFEEYVPNSGLKNLKNSDIFKNYLQKYPGYADIFDESQYPDALTRVRMTTLWSHALKLPTRNYAVGYNFVKGLNISSQLGKVDGNY